MDAKKFEEMPFAHIFAIVSLLIPFVIMIESCYVGMQVYSDSPWKIFIVGFPVWLVISYKLSRFLIYPILLVYFVGLVHMFYLYGKKENFISFYHLTWYAYPLSFLLSYLVFVLWNNSHKIR